MKNLFTLDDLSNEQILDLIKRASVLKLKEKINNYSSQKVVVANLFFEPSTRTHYSFDIAAKRLGFETINFTKESSSLKKGESLLDTVKTFEMIGVDAFVIRHPQKKYYQQLQSVKVPILSGGDGSGDHPTQSLLDLLTIYEEFKSFQGLKILIVGDIKHSRVAATNIKIMKRLGMKVLVSGPLELMKKEQHSDLDATLPQVDIVMMLRIQFERHQDLLQVSKAEYNSRYGLNLKRLKLLKKEAIIMHPQPVNRGLEISDEVMSSSQSRLDAQVSNGVKMRMLLLKEVIDAAY